MSVTYEIDKNNLIYPCRRAIFLDENNLPKHLEDIPLGYRGFRNDVGDHSGGVFYDDEKDLGKDWWFESIVCWMGT